MKPKPGFRSNKLTTTDVACGVYDFLHGGGTSLVVQNAPPCDTRGQGTYFCILNICNVRIVAFIRLMLRSAQADIKHDRWCRHFSGSTSHSLSDGLVTFCQPMAANRSCGGRPKLYHPSTSTFPFNSFFARLPTIGLPPTLSLFHPL